MKIICFIIPIFFIVCGCKEPPKTNQEADCAQCEPVEKVKNIFVIFGQSNAASSAMTDEIYTDENIFVYKNTQWVQATQALNMYSTVAPSHFHTYSLGWSFAKEYLKTHDQIRFISNARGGTSVNYWRKGKPGYDELIKRLVPVRYQIAGFLFHQGEANSKDPEYWADVVTLIMSQLRKHLDLVDRDIPVIIGQLSSMNPDYDYFNQEIFNLYDKIDGVCIAESYDLSTNPDTVHFKKSGMEGLGERYHDCFSDL